MFASSYSFNFLVFIFFLFIIFEHWESLGEDVELFYIYFIYIWFDDSMFFYIWIEEENEGEKEDEEKGKKEDDEVNKSCHPRHSTNCLFILSIFIFSQLFSLKGGW